jgi:hypothetical protein
VCLPAVAALRRGLEGAPVLFRRCVPDAVVLACFALRLAAPHSPLGQSAAALLAAAALLLVWLGPGWKELVQ